MPGGVCGGGLVAWEAGLVEEAFRKWTCKVSRRFGLGLRPLMLMHQDVFFSPQFHSTLLEDVTTWT